MIRSIEPDDYFKGYMDLINVFTKCPEEIQFHQFKDMLSKIRSQNSEIYVLEEDSKLIATIHVLYEYKLHNNLKPVCHIEDIVTDKNYRKQGHASTLIRFALQKACENNCYKVVLCTNEDNKDFYVKNGFIVKGSELCKYI
jgi:predicted GNAT family N-acyltransferase